MSGAARGGKRGQFRPVLPTRKPLTNASAGGNCPPPARHGATARPAWMVLAPGRGHPALVHSFSSPFGPSRLAGRLKIQGCRIFSSSAPGQSPPPAALPAHRPAGTIPAPQLAEPVVREGLSLRLLRGQMRRSDHRPLFHEEPSVDRQPAVLTDDAFPMDENEGPPAAVADAAAGLRTPRGARGCRNS